MKTSIVSAFTLIELMVSVMIIVLLAAAGSMALKKQQDRTALNSAVAQLKSAITETQSYAFAPLSTSDQHYILVINMTDNDQTYNSYTATPPNYTIRAKSYAIYSASNLSIEERTEVKQVAYSDIPSLSSTSAGYSDTTFFKIHFRTKDGIAGCSGNYYDDSGWSLCSPGGDYAALQLNFADQSKTIKIQKITGEIEI